jgi:hypothetical protein
VIVTNLAIYVVNWYLLRGKHDTGSMVMNSIALFLYALGLMVINREAVQVFYQLALILVVLFTGAIVIAALVFLARGGGGIRIYTSLVFQGLKLLTHPFCCTLVTVLLLAIAQGLVTLPWFS